MPGVPRELAEHALNVYLDAKPIKQTTRRYSEPKHKAIGVEVNRLLAAKFIREIKQSTDYSDFPVSKKSAPDLAFDSSKDTKEVQIHPTDPAKTAFISTTLDPK